MDDTMLFLQVSMCNLKNLKLCLKSFFITEQRAFSKYKYEPIEGSTEKVN